MTWAPTPNSGAARRFEASDERADGRRRVVTVAPDRIVIARSVAGVFMRIRLRPRAYSGILLRLASLDETGFRYEVRLTHRDPDFGVLLSEVSDEGEAEAAWRLWARFLDLPTLVERTEGILEPERPMIGAVVAHQPGARRRGRGLRWRRARFLTRRKVGRPELCVAVPRERELFGGACPGR